MSPRLILTDDGAFEDVAVPDARYTPSESDEPVSQSHIIRDGDVGAPLTFSPDFAACEPSGRRTISVDSRLLKADIAFIGILKDFSEIRYRSPESFPRASRNFFLRQVSSTEKEA